MHPTHEHQNHSGFSCVWVMDCDHLALVLEIANNALHQDIKWSSQKNIVCRVLHDMELEVQRDLADLNWDISREA